jgi:hypothetical protein
MYGLYDKEGILRFIDSDKDACIAYAELFELGSTYYCLMDLADDTKNIKVNTNLDQNLGGYNN